MRATRNHRPNEPLLAVPLSLPATGGSEDATRRTTLAAVERWIERAARGDVLEYHRGHLANDRYPDQTTLTARQRQDLDHVAERIALLAVEGRVLLVQKRIDTERIAYLAIRASAPSSRKPF